MSYIWQSLRVWYYTWRLRWIQSKELESKRQRKEILAECDRTMKKLKALLDRPGDLA